MIKHISFDLWDTIFVSNKKNSNKSFSNERLDFLVDFLKDKTREEIAFALRTTLSCADAYGEISGICTPPRQQYYHFLWNLYNEKTKSFVDKNYIDILSDYLSIIFRKNFPPLIDNNFPSILNQIKSLDITTNILCNTGMVASSDIKAALNFYGLLDKFDFVIFSDENCFFKPNNNCFYSVLNHDYCSADSVVEILHVGDNSITDIEGAENVGMKTLLFSPSNPNYGDIFKIIENEK